MVLLRLVIAEVGTVPSSAMGWVLLIVFGPVGYLLATALGEIAIKHLDSRTKQLGIGSVSRIALLVLLVAPILALVVWLTNR